MRSYRIANLNLNIDFFNKKVFNKHFSNYINNKLDNKNKDYNEILQDNNSKIKERCINIRVKVKKDIEYDNNIYNNLKFESIYNSNGHILMKDNNDVYYRYLLNKDKNIVLNKIIYDKNYSNINIYLKEDRDIKYMDLKDWEYVYTGFAFNSLVLKNGGITLHGSCISYKGNAIIFSANSGVGKSTQSKLWIEKYKQDILYVNDDKPVIYNENNNYYVYGSPWSGKDGINTNVKVPLKAIIFIKRDCDNWIEEMSISEKMLNLTEQVYRPYYDRKLDVKAINFLSKLVIDIPIFCLHCNINYDAVDVVYNKIFKEGLYEK